MDLARLADTNYADMCRLDVNVRKICGNFLAEA